MHFQDDEISATPRAVALQLRHGGRHVGAWAALTTPAAVDRASSASLCAGAGYDLMNGGLLGVIGLLLPVPEKSPALPARKAPGARLCVLMGVRLRQQF